jgi:hypothetical protein
MKQECGVWPKRGKGHTNLTVRLKWKKRKETVMEINHGNGDEGHKQNSPSCVQFKTMSASGT